MRFDEIDKIDQLSKIYLLRKKAPLHNKVDSRSQGASEPGMSLEKSISQSTCF